MRELAAAVRSGQLSRRSGPGGGLVDDGDLLVSVRLGRADDHLVVQLTNTAIPKGSGTAVVFQNLWLFKVADGRIASAQLYADTAAVRPAAA